MKSLLDIQQDIRRLENSIQEITDSVKNINLDIDNIRNSSEGAILDFSKIEAFAKQMDFRKHPLDKLNDGQACRVYLEMLLNIVRLDPDEEIIINRMVFIQWLQIRSDIDWSLEDLYKDCFKTDQQLYYEFLELIPKVYKEYFFVDALIIANIAGKANAAIYEYIADVVAILGLSSDDVKALALVSKVALSQNLEGIHRDCNALLDKMKIFGHYIRRDILLNAKKAMRVVAVDLPDSCARSFKWKVKNLQKVGYGDVIATYEAVDLPDSRARSCEQKKVEKEQSGIKEIKAPASGTIFQFRHNKTNYGVISQKNDTKDSIKAWIKTGR